jgi:lipopolysaccharide assembly protein A
MPTLFIALFFSILIAIFALQNTAIVQVRLLLWDYETSLVLVILASAMSGAILTFLASLGPRMRRTREIRSLEGIVQSQGERIRELEGTARISQNPFPPGPRKA